jgi:two-component system NtrC family sensor kinase
VRTLVDLAEQLAAGRRADEVLALVADGARRLLGATGAVLALVEGARLRVAARSGAGPALGAAAGPGACLGRTVTVTTALDAAGERVRVTVSDDGPGIPARDLDRVFEPFFTTRSDGTGLGLAICRRIVEGHGGRITIASGRDDGTHAVVELPVARERESEPVTSPGEGPPGTHGIRVLVVDDEALVAELVSEILRLDGHQVDHATNGLEALARIRTERYGLVVSDVHMPDLDGPTFYRRLLDIDPAYSDRVVFITGDVLSADTQRFLRTSGVPYLEKPFGITTFQAVVRRVLRAT